MADDRIAKALLQPQPTPGEAVWNYIKNSVPSQLGAARHLAQSVAQPFTNLFGNGGQEFWSGPQDPQAAHDMSNALLTMYAGSAVNPAEATAAKVASEPLAMRGYRGTYWDDFQRAKGAARPNGAYWASDNPAVANHYAGDPATAEPGSPIAEHGLSRTTPADFNFNNPLVVDAAHNQWDEIPLSQPALRHLDLSTQSGGITNADTLAKVGREAGHDGLVIRNVLDEGPLATTIAALRPGTVKSPLTGETLFSGGGNPVLSALLGLNSQDKK